MGQHLLQLTLAVGVGQIAPVVVGDGHPDLAVDHLQRLVDALPDHRAAQDGHPVHHALPRLAQCTGVGHVVQPQRDLVEVGAGGGVHQGVEQHPGLHGGERVDVLHPSPVTGDAVQLLLAHPSQREVRRGAAAGARGRAVLDDLAQRGEHLLGQPPHGRLVVQLGGVRPAQLQLAVLDHAVDVEHMGPGGVGAAIAVQAVQHRPVQALVGVGVPVEVELAEVVEAHLGLGAPGEVGGGRDALTEVAQGPVAQATAGHGPQLLLDGLEDVSPVVAAGVERHREDRGEPPHGAGQVDAAQDLLPPVALEVDQHPVLAAPAGQHPAEGGEQDVVDLRAVDTGDVVEQGPGLVGVERHGELAGRGERVVPLVVEGQRGVAARRHLGPVVELVVEPAGLDMLGEPQRPVPKRGGLGAEIDGLARCRLPPGPVEVVEQDPPGHPVDHQVVCDQEQLRGLVLPEVEQHRLEQRGLGEVEASVHVGDCRLDGLALVARGGGGQVVALEQGGGLGRGVSLVPPPVDVLEPQAQGVVVGGHGSQGSLERRLVDAGGQLDRERLIEVVGGHRLGLEEPVLDRGQRRRTGDRALLGHRRGLIAGAHGQRRHRLVDEQVLGHQAQAGLAGPGHHPDAENRVAAELEEVVLDPDLGDAQHLRPDPGQGRLGVGAGGHVAGTGRRSGIGGGQGPAVELAVGA